jgi:hypothetical protein
VREPADRDQTTPVAAIAGADTMRDPPEASVIARPSANGGRLGELSKLIEKHGIDALIERDHYAGYDARVF